MLYSHYKLDRFIINIGIDYSIALRSIKHRSSIIGIVWNFD